MAVNKVVRRDGTVEIDITDTTAEVDAVLHGKVFYDKSGARQVGTLETAYIAVYGITTYVELSAALSDGKAVIIKSIPNGSDLITGLVNVYSDSGGAVEVAGIATAGGDLWDIRITIDSSDTWTSSFVSMDPFMLLDFQQQLNITIPSVMTDISNTSIPNVDVAINDTLGADWAIASLAKYEVYDAASGGNRLNVVPVCMFSMNTQKTLRVRMMVAGANSKTARRISGAILLKHR
jgi:hypothetical protein